jgi:hypothetical protein
MTPLLKIFHYKLHLKSYYISYQFSTSNDHYNNEFMLHQTNSGLPFCKQFITNKKTYTMCKLEYSTTYFDFNMHDIVIHGVLF